MLVKGSVPHVIIVARVIPDVEVGREIGNGVGIVRARGDVFGNSPIDVIYIVVEPIPYPQTVGAGGDDHVSGVGVVDVRSSSKRPAAAAYKGDGFGSVGGCGGCL